MSLYDLLACPSCKGDLQRAANTLRCAPCIRSYPILNGVPVMLPDAEAAYLSHDEPLPARPGYSKWKERIVLKSLADNQVALDFGAGHQALDDPCIIRMDVRLHEYADVVADVHALPFKNASLDFCFGGAVFEHLRQPFVAARELFNALKNGGYVYADWNFLFPYHGYPHHYFNASIHGIAEAFSLFRILEAGVAPFQRPSTALRAIIGAYRKHFHPTTPQQRRFAVAPWTTKRRWHV